MAIWGPGRGGGGGGGGGGYAIEAVLEITSATALIEFTLNPDKDFHEFEFWFETNTNGDRMVYTFNSDHVNGHYLIQRAGANNGSALVSESSSTNSIDICDQSTILKILNGKIVVRNPLENPENAVRMTSVQAVNATGTTSAEVTNTQGMYKFAGDITTIQIGYRGFILSGTAGREVLKGKVIYRTEA